VAEIEVDPEAFGSDGEYTNEKVIIVDPSDPDAATFALRRAGQRLYWVTEDGRELGPADEPGEVYTPNYVSGVRLSPRGPWCYVDCKGYIPPAMRERMIMVLVDELRSAGVSARISVPSEDEL
jgi:hypothetical protein